MPDDWTFTPVSSDQSNTVFLPAGSYTFRVKFGNLANADDVSFSPEAVPEAASSVLGMLGMLTFTLRRRRL